MTKSGSDNGSRPSREMIGWIEKWTWTLEDAILLFVTMSFLCQLCLLDPKRLITIMREKQSYPSSLGCHSIISINKTVYQLAPLLPMSFEWSLRRTFRLRSNSRKMTPLAVRPIERSGVSRNAVLQTSASATVHKKEQHLVLTSQTITVPGAHLTRTWKSWPRAIWS